MRTKLGWTVLFVVLFALGARMTYLSEELGKVDPKELFVGVATLIIGLNPFTAKYIKRFSKWLDDLTPRKHAILVAAMVILLPMIMMLQAHQGHRFLVPLMHDEQMYLLQARQLASGHLAMPPLPMGEFFDTFYVFVKPVYASMYFPGTALAYVPSIWLNMPYWTWPVLIMTGLFVFTYLVAARILGRLIGLVTIVAMLAAPLMAWMSTSSMSHPLGGLFGMMILYAWIRWRASPRLGWAVMLGVASGWMLISRPLESFCYTLPVLIAILCSIRRPTLFSTLTHATVAIACALPFIVLQLAFDRAVTGSVLSLPINYYVQQQFTGVNVMGEQTGDLQVTSTLPQKIAMLHQFVKPMAKIQQTTRPLRAFQRRTAFMLVGSLASPLMFFFLSLSIPMLKKTEIRVLMACFVLFCAAYFIYGNYVAQYTSQIMAVVTILALCGVCALTDVYTRHSGMILGGYLAAVLGISCTVLTMMNFSGTGNEFDWRTMYFNYHILPNVVKIPALVMFRYGPKSSPFVEPVYNLEAATPDECPVIRAHDFGPQRDLKLFRYYAAFQPDRHVYLFDRDSSQLKSLGTVAELVHNAPAATAPATTTTGP